MTITREQVVLAESQVMADTDDGGGRMSGVIVEEGAINNTYPDVSRLDRVYGRVQLRKLYLSIRAANQDTFLGAHTITSRNPADPRVRVTLFQTGSHTDRRTQAQDRIESYVVKATETNFWLWGDQLEGQRAISALQRLDAKAPEPGEVYTLTSEDGQEEQYVRVTDVEVGRQTFTISSGNGFYDFELQTLQISLANQLGYLFEGSEPRPTGRQSGAARVLSTQVADAARYYGLATLSASAAPGDLTATVDSVYNNLVPSAQSETALTDRNGGPGRQPVVAASSSTITVNADDVSQDGEGYAVYYAGRAIVPRTLVVSGSNGSYEDGGGSLDHVSGSDRVEASEIDYQEGVVRIKWTSSGYRNNPVSLTFTPGAAYSQQAYTESVAITLQNRALNYVYQVRPVAAPGTLIVEYRALGRWATLADRGDGVLEGDGTGQIDFQTGTINITLSGLPDVDTEIIYSWGDDQSFDIQDGTATPTVPEVVLQISEAGKAIGRGSLLIAWDIGGTEYSLSDNSDGTLTGDGSGRVEYGAGRIRFRPNPAPQISDGDYTVSFDEWNGAAKQTDSVAAAEMQITRTLPNAPIEPGSVVLTATMTRLREYIDYYRYQSGPTFDDRRSYDLEVTVYDDGQGNLVRDGVSIGTVDYSTGDVVFDARVNYTYAVQTQQELGGGGTEWYKQSTETGTETYKNSSSISFEYTVPSDPVAAIDTTVPVQGIDIDLVPGSARPIIPGSLLFTFGGKLYRDRSGAIIADWSSTTDAGTNVGSIDYSTGVVTLNEWASGVNATTPATLTACLTWYGERVTKYTSFRTAGAPLRQGSLVLNAVTLEGDEVSVQAATDGTLTDPLIASGSVDTETGIVSIEWASPVFPTSVKYSAVAFTYLPLDPDLLGLDPTRLPSDGRVPIFLPGDVGVFSHTIETEVASPTAGGTLAFTRDHQAEVWVKGANGRNLDPAQYTLDREAGVLTWADPLTLEDEEANAVTTPLTVYDRVEDMVLITDVQVSGQIGFNAQLSQNYPAGEATLSSAVLHGDLRARVYNLFHQASWTNTWSDERIGNDTTAKYNDVAYPIEITNQGSIKERWLIRFTSSTSFEVVGETVGVIGTGTISADTAIANPATGAPYFTIRSGGWGTGWNAGNSVRFNTDGAQAPFWIARTILSGPETASSDSFATQNRGDAD